KGLYHPFCIFEPNIFYFHTCKITDNHFPKQTTGMVRFCFVLFFFPTYLPDCHWFQFILYTIKINLLILERFLG
ncbi:hypothetical protein LDENG_00162570, partial [Lucifuga dentata]